MNINFTIGLGFLEFCCHFVAMVCYFVAGYFFGSRQSDEVDYLISFVAVLFGMMLSTIGAHL
jgi:hypothetical protein